MAAYQSNGTGGGDWSSLASWAGSPAHPPIIGTDTATVLAGDQINIDKVLPIALERGLGVIAKRPIANAGWRPAESFRGLYVNYSRPYAERLQKMGLRPADLGFDGSPAEVWPEIALRFTLSIPGSHTAIVGTTNPINTRANIAAAAKGPLPETVVQKIRDAFRHAEKQSGEQWLGLT